MGSSEEDPPHQRWSRATAIWLVALLLGAALVAYRGLWRRPGAPQAMTERGGTPPPASPAPAKTAPSGAPPTSVHATGSSLEQTWAALRGTGDPAEARRLLQRLREYLRSLPKAEAVALVTAFLNGAADAPTRLDFKIVAGGQLSEAPTLRVWLLDCLAEIDPAAAAEYARGVLATAGSPDEWAVCLRDYARARHAPEDAAFLELKLRQMLGNAAWKQAPSAGLLEAFDLIVHLRASGFTPDLARMVGDRANPALGHAAYLTLDRLVQQNPAAVLGQLQARPAMMAGREQTRANFFARADVRDATQRGLLESYLLDPARGLQELQTFAGLYPSANFMVSNNLLTPSATPSQAELAGRDRAALELVGQWMGDERFAQLRPQLAQIQRRLQEFVGQSR